MDVTIHNAKNIGGHINAIPSKSMAHRYLICAALSNGKSFIRCSQTSKDIDATIDCLIKLGATINRNNDIYEVIPINREIVDGNNRRINCGESGSTLRFLLPIISALGIDACVDMQGRLSSRPLSPLYEEMIKHGCTMSEQGSNPLSLQGQLTSGEYVIDGSVSSQFISGLLFALPLLDGDSRIVINGRAQSIPYIHMTIRCLSEFGIRIDSNICNEKDEIVLSEIYFNIKGNQQYVAKKDLFVEGDWSNIAFWLCAGAIGNNEITCSDIRFDSVQGDKKICHMLERFGAEVIYSDDNDELGDYVCVKNRELKAITIDARDIPDLIPILSVVAATANGTTAIVNASRLRLKESDRLDAITKTLKSIGADVIELDDGLVIHGKKRLEGGVVDSFNDHRIAMMASIASIVCEKEVCIHNAEAVAKSYPTFFEDLKKMGACITIDD